MAAMHSNSGGGSEDPDPDGPDMVHLRLLLSRDVPDRHDVRPAGERDEHQDRVLLRAGRLPELRRGHLHDGVGGVPGQRGHPDREAVHGQPCGPDAAAADGRGAAPRGPGAGGGGAGGDVAAAPRAVRRRREPEHRVAAAPVRDPGLLRRVLRHRAAGVLLLGGAGVDAQPVLGVPVPGHVAGVLREHAGGLGGGGRDDGGRRARVAPRRPERRPPRLLLLAVDGDQRGELRRVHCVRQAVHAQEGGPAVGRGLCTSIYGVRSTLLCSTPGPRLLPIVNSKHRQISL
jgi:hypothetical protein